MTAKNWRHELSEVDFSALYKSFRSIVEQHGKPKNFFDAKLLTDSILNSLSEEDMLNLGMTVFGVTEYGQKEILKRWETEGKQPLSMFAPYLRHLLSVELYFYVGLGSDLISKDRPSNKVDLAYLYYLPFCMVFTSSDKLHANIVPPFLRDHQTFIAGTCLKEDLNKLNKYYLSLPEEILSRGISTFAQNPPIDSGFLVSELWDKYLPR